MLARIQECILYRNFSNGEILNDMTELINLYESDEEALKAKEDQFFKSVNGLVELAGMYGFSGNIWHTYLTFLLVNHENAFSMASEIRGAIKGSINDLAKNDFQIFKELYDFDITVFDRVFETGPVFRAEKHNTKRHLNEYTSLDFEMGYIDSFEEIMAMETGFLQYAMNLLKTEYAKDKAPKET